MADILRSEDYPQGFHLGFSFILWVILISLLFTVMVIYILRARKEHALHRKQLLFSSSILFLGFGLDMLFIQIGSFNLDYFALCMSIAITIVSLSLVYFFYFWEKFVISYKKIPTLYCIFIFLFTLTNTVMILVFNETIFTLFSTYYVILVSFLGILICAVLMHFTYKVIGNLRIRAFAWILATILLLIGVSTDHPPLINMAPDFFMIFTPLILISSIFIWYYGFNGVIDGLTSFYQQERKCIVHRGVIHKDNRIFYCPSCSAIYCENCYSEVIKKDGCWICGEGYKPSEEEKWAYKESETVSVKVNNKSIINHEKVPKKKKDAAK